MSDTDFSLWEPTSSLNHLHQRADLYRSIRQFFTEKNVLEVETPILSQSASCDVNLDSFSTQATQNNLQTYYLQTSPEFAMKRLLAAGAGSIFQISKSFRQGELGRHHNPEFTMLEWYRVGFTMGELIDELIELLMTCFHENISFSTVSYAQLYEHYVGINPHTTTLDVLVNFALSKHDDGMAAICGDSLSNGLDYIFSQYIQPNLKPNVVYVVTDYPCCMAMLAKLNTNNPVTANRFEVYYKNLELANGYEELTDALEQKRRFENELEERQKLGADNVPMDGYLLAALKHGLPECSGVALGIDRLLMLMTQSSSIDEVLSFPINRA